MQGTSRVIRCAMHLIHEFFEVWRMQAFRPGRAVAAVEFVGGGSVGAFIAEFVIRGPIPGGLRGSTLGRIR